MENNTADSQVPEDQVPASPSDMFHDLDTSTEDAGQTGIFNSQPLPRLARDRSIPAKKKRKYPRLDSTSGEESISLLAENRGGKENTPRQSEC